MTTNSKTAKLIVESGSARAVLVTWERDVQKVVNGQIRTETVSERVVVIETRSEDALGNDRWTEVVRYDEDGDESVAATFGVIVGDESENEEIPDPPFA